MGYKDSMKLVNSKAIQLVDTLSTKIGVSFSEFQGPIIFNESKNATLATKRQDLEKRIDDTLKILGFIPPLNLHKKQKIVELFLKAHSIGDTKSVFDEVRNQFVEKFHDPVVRKVLNLPIENLNKSENNGTELQYRTNRLLHYFYYQKISKIFKCDYVMTPLELRDIYTHFYNENETSKDRLSEIFTEIRNLEKIPNIPKLYLEGILNIDDILNMRNTKQGLRFRKWIDDLSKSTPMSIDSNEFTSLYHEACMTNSKFSKIYNSKAIQLLRTTVLFSIGFFQPYVSGFLTLSDWYISNGTNSYKPSEFSIDLLKKHVRNKCTK